MNATVERKPVWSAFVGLVFALSLYAGSADATIIDNGDITTDTNTGLAWLDINLTKLKLSYNAMTLQFGTGGTFEGYRYATITELDQFLTDFGFVGPFTGIDPADNAVSQTFLALVGTTGASTALGLTADAGGLGHKTARIIGAYSVYNAKVTVPFSSQGDVIVFDGHWLVKDVAVPEPSTLVLFVLALICLTFTTRIFSALDRTARAGHDFASDEVRLGNAEQA